MLKKEINGNWQIEMYSKVEMREIQKVEEKKLASFGGNFEMYLINDNNSNL